MVRLGGGFRRARLEGPARQRSKPLEMSETEKRWMAMTPPGASGARLERQKFKPTPKPKELEPGLIYARAAAVGDLIMAASDHGDVVLKVVEQSPFMTVCVNVATGKALGVLPSCIVEVASL